MVRLNTITTIELSNICNLRCGYCINRLLVKNSVRNAGIMSEQVFDATLELLKELVKRGTQRDINLHGNGEPLLDKDFIKRAKRVRSVLGDNIPMLVCTNGVNMTEELARMLKDSGLTRIDVSPHDAYHARKAVDILVRNGLYGGVINLGPITSSHNWCNQLEPEHRVTNRIKAQCDSLIEGRGYVQKEGFISPCCYDYRNLGAYGTVFDVDIFKKPIRPYSLCRECHQMIPDWIYAMYAHEAHEVQA